MSRPSSAIEGVVPGSVDHRLLLALRGPGGMTSDQVYNRFTTSPSGALFRLKELGLIDVPTPGLKSHPIRLTQKGATLIDPAGPLARRKTLINYCQL